jgi:hypothetical protein
MTMSVCIGADPLIGQWDYVDEAPMSLSGDKTSFVLESKPEKTRFDFDGKWVHFYRDDHVVYEMEYAILSVNNDIITVELSVPKISAGKYTHTLFLKGSILQASHGLG